VEFRSVCPLKTLDLIVNSQFQPHGVITRNGKSQSFLVEPLTRSASARRVYLASIFLDLGCSEVALKVKVPTGRREVRVDVMAQFSNTMLIVSVSSESKAQVNSAHLKRIREVMEHDLVATDMSIRGLVAVEGSMDRAGNLDRSLRGWAIAAPIEDAESWSLNDILGQ
jgi:hypothetical protein